MRKISGILTAAVLLLALTGQSSAFCVHNKSDKNMNVNEVSGGSYSKHFSKSPLYSGQDACCHWSNTDCNKSGGKTDPVSFSVYIDAPGTIAGGSRICEDATIPACSDLDITGSNGNYNCVTHGTETCN